MSQRLGSPRGAGAAVAVPTALVVALCLVGCASPPAAPPPASGQPPAAVATTASPAPTAEAATPDATPEQPQARGQVVARNDRLLIYRSAPGDSLDAVAARFQGSAAQAWQIADANGLSRIQATQPLPETLIVPLRPLNPLGVLADRVQTVPILCYHRLGAGNSKMVVSPANFEAQLTWLVRNDYRVIRLAELAGFLAGERALPQRAVVITFDDGYESVYRHAFPVLKKLGLPATAFVYTDFLGGGDALTWPQLQEMQSSGLVDVQSHSKSHRNLIERRPGETEQSYRSNIDAEMRVPREVLERRLPPLKVRHLAYPFGDANESVIESASRHGIELAATVVPGGNPFFAQPLLLRRTMIFGDTSLDVFKSKVQVSRSFSAP